jgi:cell division septum initiation protein DivIVA
MQDEDNIDIIIEQLKRLTIQQQQLTQQIAELQTEIQSRSSNDTTVAASSPIRAQRKNKSIKVGDRVKIKNPRKHQQNEGIVDSFTATGLFARVKLDNNTIINRAPKNLTLIDQA